MSRSNADDAILPLVVVVGHGMRAVALLHSLQPFLHPAHRCIRLAWVTNTPPTTGTADVVVTQHRVAPLLIDTFDADVLRKQTEAAAANGDDTDELVQALQEVGQSITVNSQMSRLLAPHGVYRSRVVAAGVVANNEDDGANGGSDATSTTRLPSLLLEDGTRIPYSAVLLTASTLDCLPPPTNPQGAECTPSQPVGTPTGRNGGSEALKEFHLFDPLSCEALYSWLEQLSPISYQVPRIGRRRRTMAQGSGGDFSPGIELQEESSSDYDYDDDDDGSGGASGTDSDEEPPTALRPHKALLELPYDPQASTAATDYIMQYLGRLALTSSSMNQPSPASAGMSPSDDFVAQTQESSSEPPEEKEVLGSPTEENDGHLEVRPLWGLWHLLRYNTGGALDFSRLGLDSEDINQLCLHVKDHLTVATAPEDDPTKLGHVLVGSSLTELNLADNCLDAFSVATLMSTFLWDPTLHRGVTSGLQSLILDDNLIGDDGLRCVMSSLLHLSTRQCQHTLCTAPKVGAATLLSKLSFANCGLTDYHAVTKLLQLSPTIRSLNLSGNKDLDNNDGVTDILRAVPAEMREVYLSNMDLGEDMCSALHQLMASTSRSERFLEVLDLSHNYNLGDEVAKSIGQALLDSSRPHLHTLLLHGCKSIGPLGVHFILKAAASLESDLLRALTLAGCQSIGAAEVPVAATILGTSDNLQRLSLSIVYFEQLSATLLLEQLTSGNCPTLTDLMVVIDDDDVSEQPAPGASLPPTFFASLEEQLQKNRREQQVLRQLGHRPIQEAAQDDYCIAATLLNTVHHLHPNKEEEEEETIQASPKTNSTSPSAQPEEEEEASCHPMELVIVDHFERWLNELLSEDLEASVAANVLESYRTYRRQLLSGRFPDAKIESRYSQWLPPTVEVIPTDIDVRLSIEEAKTLPSPFHHLAQGQAAPQTEDSVSLPTPQDGGRMVKTSQRLSGQVHFVPAGHWQQQYAENDAGSLLGVMLHSEGVVRDVLRSIQVPYPIVLKKAATQCTSVDLGRAMYTVAAQFARAENAEPLSQKRLRRALKTTLQWSSPTEFAKWAVAFNMGDVAEASLSRFNLLRPPAYADFSTASPEDIQEQLEKLRVDREVEAKRNKEQREALEKEQSAQREKERKKAAAAAKASAATKSAKGGRGDDSKAAAAEEPATENATTLHATLSGDAATFSYKRPPPPPRPVDTWSVMCDALAACNNSSTTAPYPIL